MDFDAADYRRLQSTTRKTMNLQDLVPPFPIDQLQNHYVLVFDLISMQDASENCRYQEFFGEFLKLKLELNITSL